MTRVSRFKLKDRFLEKIFDLFFTVIGQMRDKQSFRLILPDILSPAERIMIAKRITIMYLLLKEIDQRTICNILKVSSGTVARYNLLLEKSTGIVPVLRKMIKKDKMEIFFLELFNTLYGPGVYGTNWKAGQERKVRIQQLKQTGL